MYKDKKNVLLFCSFKHFGEYQKVSSPNFVFAKNNILTSKFHLFFYKRKFLALSKKKCNGKECTEKRVQKLF